eukprot:3765742-Lingulodinium_polyedra.AAC.1
MVNASDKQSWYQQWLDANQSWGKLVLLEEHRKGTKDLDNKKWCDLTRDQIEELYKSAAIADALVEQKTRMGEWRPHPELPDMKAAILYRCLVETSKLEQTFKGSVQIMGLTGEADDSAAALLGKSM